MTLPTQTLASQLTVSVIGQGTAVLGTRVREGALDEASAIRLIHGAIDGGIRLFDTAEGYGQGAAEEILGRALKTRRGAAAVATKFSAKNSSRERLVAACEGSLRRLEVETIDLYQSHWPNPGVPFEETVAAMVSLVEAGKVRAIGFSNITNALLAKVRTWMPAAVPIATVQQEYSLIERSVEYRCLPVCRAQGIAVLAYSPFANGKLTGAAAVEPLAAFAREAGMTPAAMALAWLLRQPGVIPIPESNRPEGIAANIAAAGVTLPDDVYALLDAAFKPSIQEISPEQIRVVGARSGSAFTSLEEARNNTLGLSPSPADVAKELEDGEMLKPIKVRPRADAPGQFDLFEGQLRFWAWQIAHGPKKPILARVESA